MHYVDEPPNYWPLRPKLAQGHQGYRAAFRLENTSLCTLAWEKLEIPLLAAFIVRGLQIFRVRGSSRGDKRHVCRRR